MKFKYPLSQELKDKASSFDEFANGGAQATLKLKDGSIYEEALLSNCSAIIALRGHEDLPFAISEIIEIYQTEKDKKPTNRGGWDFWDDWENKLNTT